MTDFHPTRVFPNRNSKRYYLGSLLFAILTGVLVYIHVNEFYKYIPFANGTTILGLMISSGSASTILTLLARDEDDRVYPNSATIDDDVEE